MDYNQRLALSTSIIVNIKLANLYLLTVYFAYHLTSLTHKKPPPCLIGSKRVASSLIRSHYYFTITSQDTANFTMGYHPPHPSLASFCSS